MTVTRRATLLALPLAAMAPSPRRIRPRPGAQPCSVTATFEPPSGAQTILHVRLLGPGAPTGTVRVGSWYGRARVHGAVSAAGRDLLLIASEGNRGTGVYQEWLVIAGCDNAGAFRVLGIEVLSCRESQGMSGRARLAGRMMSAGSIGLRIGYESTRVLPLPRREGRPPVLGPPVRERWRTLLPWNGDAALPASPSPPNAGPVQRQADATRARVAALLASPVTDVTALEDALGQAGLYDLGSLYPEALESS